MTIPKHKLEEMNKLLEGGMNISDIWVNYYHQYDYWEIYWAVKDFSLLGKKRMITNRLNAAKTAKTSQERIRLIEEANDLITEIYELTKKNGQKLIEISKILK